MIYLHITALLPVTLFLSLSMTFDYSLSPPFFFICHCCRLILPSIGPSLPLPLLLWLLSSCPFAALSLSVLAITVSRASLPPQRIGSEVGWRSGAAVWEAYDHTFTPTHTQTARAPRVDVPKHKHACTRTRMRLFIYTQ